MQIKIKYSILFLIVNYIWVVGNLQLHSHVHEIVDKKKTCEHQDHHTDEDNCAVCYFQFTPINLVDFNSFEFTNIPYTFTFVFNEKPILATIEQLNAGLFNRGPPSLTV